MTRIPSAHSVALFRASADAARSASALAALGVRAVVAPVVEIAALDAAAPEAPFDFVVATSAHAFTAASPEWLQAVRAAPLHVVGARTAEAARARGLSPVGEAAADVAALAARLASTPGRALYLAGRDRRADLEQALQGRVVTLVVYEARERDGWSEPEAKAVAEASVALHYSERSAALALRFAAAAGLAAAFGFMPHVCLSRQAAGPLAAAGASRVLWPQAPTEAALFDALESALADFGAA